MNLTSAQSWQQAETLIRAFFDEYDGLGEIYPYWTRFKEYETIIDVNYVERGWPGRNGNKIYGNVMAKGEVIFFTESFPEALDWLKSQQ